MYLPWILKVHAALNYDKAFSTVAAVAAAAAAAAVRGKNGTAFVNSLGIQLRRKIYMKYIVGEFIRSI